MWGGEGVCYNDLMNSPLESDRDIPIQYRGLRSDVVEELWTPKLYVDPVVQQRENERREDALKAIRRKEQGEEEIQKGQDLQKISKIRGSLGVRESKSEAQEKEEAFIAQVQRFLSVVVSDKGMRDTIEKWRNSRFLNESDVDFKKRQSLNDLEVFSRMSKGMYDLIHTSGMSYEDVMRNINIPNKDEFICNFSSEIRSRLINAVSQTSKARPITEEELIRGGQPDQAAGFVWFKGNALRPADAREVRFYVNASPDGTKKVAEYLGKLSDQLDQYGMRLQFKFRADIGEYDRTDTCVVYLYMPKGANPEQQKLSDQWLGRVKEAMAHMPQDALRKQNSFFTESIADGVSFTEDKRDPGSKKGESYTSQITKTVAESCGELAGQHDSLNAQATEQIAARTIEKLKQMKYL